jgi:hypothetical protein
VIAHEYNSDQHGYRQSLPIEWLKMPEEVDRTSLLEFVRGSLCSLSVRNDGRFETVHISRIRRSFEMLGAPGLSGMCQCFETTASLNLVSFGGGFWVGCRSLAGWVDINLVGHARRLGYTVLEAMRMAIKGGNQG